jgi:hypothetical protein
LKGQQSKITEAEKSKREATGRTQGRTGCRMQRINLGVYSDNWQWLAQERLTSGRTNAEIINEAMSEYRRAHNA